MKFLSCTFVTLLLMPAMLHAAVTCPTGALPSDCPASIKHKTEHKKNVDKSPHNLSTKTKKSAANYLGAIDTHEHQVVLVAKKIQKKTAPPKNVASTPHQQKIKKYHAKHNHKLKIVTRPVATNQVQQHHVESMDSRTARIKPIEHNHGEHDTEHASTNPSGHTLTNPGAFHGDAPWKQPQPSNPEPVQVAATTTSQLPNPPAPQPTFTPTTQTVQPTFSTTSQLPNPPAPQPTFTPTTQTAQPTFSTTSQLPNPPAPQPTFSTTTHVPNPPGHPPLALQQVAPIVVNQLQFEGQKTIHSSSTTTGDYGILAADHVEFYNSDRAQIHRFEDTADLEDTNFHLIVVGFKDPF